MGNPIKNPPPSKLNDLYESYLSRGMTATEARQKICAALAAKESTFYGWRAKGSMPPAKIAMMEALIKIGTL